MSITQEKRQERIDYSEERLDDLKNRLEDLTALKTIPNLTIYAAGSYSRKEASEHSDIDLFFLTPTSKHDVQELNISSLKMFGQVIEVVESMLLPTLSNDGEYLRLIHTNEILENLGGRVDDHQNFFTARMLLLLEGHCLYGQDQYDQVSEQIVSSYFYDYPKHSDSFHPRFLLNDICRFWKTLLLNYENKRRYKLTETELASKYPQCTTTEEAQEIRKIDQKVRNFKLKYSRMTTCFATIASLASTPNQIDTQRVLELTQLTPYQRLESVPHNLNGTKKLIQQILESYAWFLDQTGLSKEDLHDKFSDESKRKQMFEKAQLYGDLMFELLREVDKEKPDLNLFRNLVI